MFRGVVWLAAVVMIVATAAVAEAAVCQGAAANVRTYGGVSYTVKNLSLESFYTIGELKETPSAPQPFTATTSISATAAAPQAAGGEQEAEEKMLRGHSWVGEITVVRGGAETAIPLERVTGMLFVRTPIRGSAFPPYISHYRYSVHVSLLDGQTVPGDYVNLGTTVLRGTTVSGQVEVPWEEIERVMCETR